MNIKETKAAIAVMQAYVDGKEIEGAPKVHGEKDAEPYQWFLMNLCPSWDWYRNDYRVAVTKPSINWDHVAPKIVAIARNEDGIGLCFTKIPSISGDDWACSGGEVYPTFQFASYTPGTCDWKDSLVVRPGEKP